MADVRVLVVQPSEIDPPGKLGEWLVEAGAELAVVPADSPDLPANLDGVDALVVLGGEMHALDDAQHPWLRQVRGLLSESVSKRVPTLGICLGAQLLAAATGGQVGASPQGPDAGPKLIAKRDIAAEDVLLGPVALTPDVVQFRRDEVTALPPTAQLLASAPHTENQAFRVGDCGYGFQFHIETTTDTVLSWSRAMPSLAEAARPGHLEREHLDQIHDDLAETWQPVAQRFVRLAATPPEERTASRFLPMA